MPRKVKSGFEASLDFTRFQLNLLIRATEHLMDAYGSSVTSGDKATVTNLQNLRDYLSKAASKLIEKEKQVRK